MMRNDPLYQYTRLELARSRGPMSERHIPFDFPKDPLNRHYLEQAGWMAVENHPVVWPFVRRHLGAMMIRVGARLEGGTLGVPATAPKGV